MIAGRGAADPSKAAPGHGLHRGMEDELRVFAASQLDCAALRLGQRTTTANGTATINGAALGLPTRRGGGR
ncbi:MAG TPA: hypothetical protein VGL99_21830, partial [Chloroflexota bacterium]